MSETQSVCSQCCTMMPLCCFLLLHSLFASAVYRESGDSVTLVCSSAGCFTSIEGYTGMYLYQELKEVVEVLYYSEPTGKLTPRERFIQRIQISGSLKNLIITISNLTVDDAGLYTCAYRKMHHEVQCNVYSLFVRDRHIITVVEETGGREEASVLQPPASAEPCASSPLLLIIASCIITALIIVIFILLIILRVKQWTSSREPAETGQTSNDYVYEVMTKNGLRPFAPPRQSQPSL